jgi:predicted permease
MGMNGLLEDILYGVRVLLGRPGFTIVAALVLTLAIGANVAIFSFIETALLRPLPYRDPQRLVKIWDSRKAEVYSRFEASYPDYLDWKQQNQAFNSLAAYSGSRNGILNGTDGPQMVPVGCVSDNFFQTLGVAPLFGRVFQPGEDLDSAPRYVVLSYGFWQRQFGGRRDILGQSLTLNSEPQTIVGILPRNFHFGLIGDADVYVTLHATGGMQTRRNLHWLHPFGRLKPGVSLDQAQVMMNALAAGLEKQYPDSNKELRTVLVPLTEVITGQIKPILMVLLAAVGMLLLIACANLANLLLARSASRAKEFAIRSALGARRWRVMRQLIVEGMLLASVGTAAGIVFAIFATRWMILTLPQKALQSMPYLKGATVEPRILLFAAALGLLTALLFSLPPALGLPAPLNIALKQGGQLSVAVSWKKIGSFVVVTEVAISAVLLVGSGLLLKSLYRLLSVDTGFNVSRLTTFYVFPDSKRYDEDAQANLLHDKLIDVLARGARGFGNWSN